MPPHTLFVPAYLPAVGFAVFLGVEFGGADRGAGVDEEQTGHGEGCQRGHYCAAVDDAAAAGEARGGGFGGFG